MVKDAQLIKIITYTVCLKLLSSRISGILTYIKMFMAEEFATTPIKIIKIIRIKEI